MVDPRSIFIREILQELGEEAKADPLLKVAFEIDRIASTDEYFTSRKLNPNADLFASFAYKAMLVSLLLRNKIVDRSQNIIQGILAQLHSSVVNHIANPRLFSPLA